MYGPLCFQYLHNIWVCPCCLGSSAEAGPELFALVETNSFGDRFFLTWKVSRILQSGFWGGMGLSEELMGQVEKMTSVIPLEGGADGLWSESVYVYPSVRKNGAGTPMVKMFISSYVENTFPRRDSLLCSTMTYILYLLFLDQCNISNARTVFFHFV